MSTESDNTIPRTGRISIYMLRIQGFSNVTLCSWLSAKPLTDSIIYYGYHGYLISASTYLVGLPFSGPLHVIPLNYPSCPQRRVGHYFVLRTCRPLSRSDQMYVYKLGQIYNGKEKRTNDQTFIFDYSFSDNGNMCYNIVLLLCVSDMRRYTFY